MLGHAAGTALYSELLFSLGGVLQRTGTVLYSVGWNCCFLFLTLGGQAYAVSARILGFLFVGEYVYIMCI